MFREDLEFITIAICHRMHLFCDEEALKYIDYMNLDIRVYPNGKYHFLG